MNTETKAFLFSFALHLSIIATAAAFVGMPAHEKPPVFIDFTLAGGSGAKKGSAMRDPGSAPPSRRASSVRRAKTAEPLPTLPKPDPPIAPKAAPFPSESSPEAAPIASSTASAQLPPLPGATNGNGSVSSLNGSGSGTGNGTALGSGTGAGGDGKGESAEALRMRYLKKHFAYIRDMIARNLRYPCLARRMGWSGSLAVEFVVLMDGSTNNVRIVRSSGFPLLDKNARNTVMKSAPFPKPPVSARLVIPVEYLLEN